MKLAIFIEDTDTLMQNALSITHRNRLIKTVPQAYKNVIRKSPW